MRPRWISLSRFSLLLVAVSGVWVVSCQSSPSPDAGRAGNPADEAASRDGPAPEVVDLAPDSRPGFGMRNVFAPITGLFMGGPSYWYGPREVEIDTTPPGGLIDLFYVRRNFQKRFEQAEAPVIVLLPKRIEAGPRDSVKVRAYREGYRQEEVSFRVSSRRVKVLIDLEPLPNTLEAIAHSYFVGRASLVFLTKEALTSRLQEADDGFSLILLETAQSPDAIASIEHVRSPLIEKMWAQQLGEDLQIRVFLTELARTREVQLRSRESYDVARELYSFSLDLVPASGGGDAVRRTLAALDALEQRHVSGCSLRFDQTLREDLDPGSLARALVPNGRFVDPYLRAAMRRLGEVSPGGVVQFGGGTEYRPAVPIELEAALMQASGAAGYLALLRQLVKELESEEYQRETLRGLIAPELDAGRFETFVDAAEARERDCLAAAARG